MKRVAANDGEPGARVDEVPASTPSICDRGDVEARLLAVSDSEVTTELVVVLRGTVRPWYGSGRKLWRVRLADGHYRVVSAESVLAVTPVRQGAPSLLLAASRRTDS